MPNIINETIVSPEHQITKKIVGFGSDGRRFIYPPGYTKPTAQDHYGSIGDGNITQRSDLPHLEMDVIKLSTNLNITVKNLVVRKVYKNYPALAVEGSLNGPVMSGKINKIHTSKLLSFKHEECLSLSKFDTMMVSGTIEFVYENFRCDPELSEYILPLKDNDLGDIDLYICTFYKEGWFMFVPRVLVRVFFNTKDIEAS